MILRNVPCPVCNLLNEFEFEGVELDGGEASFVKQCSCDAEIVINLSIEELS